MFPFLSPVNSFLHLFATFCSLQHSEHYLFIMRSIFFGTCCWTLTDNIGGGGGGGGIGYTLCLQCNQYCAIKTKACLFFASRGPAIRWA